MEEAECGMMAARAWVSSGRWTAERSREKEGEKEREREREELSPEAAPGLGGRLEWSREKRRDAT